MLRTLIPIFICLLSLVSEPLTLIFCILCFNDYILVKFCRTLMHKWDQIMWKLLVILQSGVEISTLIKSSICVCVCVHPRGDIYLWWYEPASLINFVCNDSSFGFCLLSMIGLDRTRCYLEVSGVAERNPIGLNIVLFGWDCWIPPPEREQKLYVDGPHRETIKSTFRPSSKNARIS